MRRSSSGPARGSLGSNLTVNKLGGFIPGCGHQPVACGPGDLVEGHIRFGRHRACILGTSRHFARVGARATETCDGWTELAMVGPTCRVVARGKAGRRTKLLVQTPRRDGGLCSCSFSGHTASEHLSSKWSCAHDKAL